MENKKTVYVWIILVLSAIGIVFGLFSFIQNLINIKTLIMPVFLSSPAMNIANFVLQTAGTALLFIFFIKLYNLSQNLVKWVHIIFGYLFFGIFFSIFIIVSTFKIPIIFALKFMNPLVIIVFIIVVLIIGIIWFTFVRHLRNKYEQYKDKNTNYKIDIKKLLMNVLGFVFLVIIIIVIVNADANQKQQKKVNEDNRIRIEEEVNSVVLPASFIIESVRSGINEGGDSKDFSQKLTFIDNILTEGEYFYNIKEGPHCTNNSNNCIHNKHCVVANGQWSGDDECSGQSPTIKDIKQNLSDTMMYIKLEELDKCPLSEYVTCYKIIEIK